MLSPKRGSLRVIAWVRFLFPANNSDLRSFKRTPRAHPCTLRTPTKQKLKYKNRATNSGREKAMKKYVYLVKNRADGKKYVAYGNFKYAFFGKGYLFEFVSERNPYKQFTPYGWISNISTGILYDSKKHQVIHQAEYQNLKREKKLR